jgi:hypothetical protein
MPRLAGTLTCLAVRAVAEEAATITVIAKAL